jgi:BirA family biotin operon repressor/biotin-[acetyl-CoA-carboxylase] ligase
MVSALLRPAAVPPEDTTPESATPEAVPPARRGWLPLLTGVAAATAVRQVTGVPAVLKWPNDLLVGDRKLAGILAEQSGDAIVVGIGLNVSITGDELPDTGPGALPATSLLLENAASLDRTALLTALLEQLSHWYRVWRHARPPGDPDQSGLRQAYLDLCATIGRDVGVERPAGHVTAGRAAGLDPDGRLIVAGPDGDEAVSAGDVRHLR